MHFLSSYHLIIKLFDVDITGLSTSTHSLPPRPTALRLSPTSLRSHPSPGSSLHIDEHRQLIDSQEVPKGSDTDTSLFDYEDDHL